MPGRQLLEYVAADVARQVLAERQLAPWAVGAFLRQDERPVAALAERKFQRVGDAAAMLGSGDKSVHHDVDRDLRSSRRDEVGLVQFPDHPAEAHTLEAALAKARKLVPKHARPRLEHRGKEHHPLA